MQALARERGGECLSNAWVSTQHKLQWLCARGHAWSTTPATVLKGSWYPQCAILERCGSDMARRRYEAVPLPEWDTGRDRSPGEQAMLHQGEARRP